MIFSEGLSERKLNASNTDKRFADPKDSERLVLYFVLYNLSRELQLRIQ